MDYIVIPVALAMDAFAVSIGLGVCIQNVDRRKLLKVPIYFGFFQFLMPLLGFYLGRYFISYIRSVDHWIAFGLLAYIGVNMIRESFNKKNDSNCEVKDHLGKKNMFILSIATSIDALAVGVAFAMVYQTIWKMSIATGIITFLLSFLGILAGNFLGKKFGKFMEMIGGIILISIGIKILIEHVFLKIA